MSNCGGCNKQCNLSHTNSHSCASGTCKVGSCDSGYGNCDGNHGNGCETNINSSTSHCGGCNKKCNLSHTYGHSCSNGSCKVGSCDSGYGNCDGNHGNGCETNKNSSTNHCGGCNKKCNLPYVDLHKCSSGSCEAVTCDDSSDAGDSRWSPTNFSGRDDCDIYYKSISEPIQVSGDKDWYKFHVEDAWGCGTNPVMTATLTNLPKNYDLYVFYDCDSGNADVDCKVGTKCKWTANSFPDGSGCCSWNTGTASETIDVEFNCTGTTTDSGYVYIVVNPKDLGQYSCQPFKLKYNGF